MGRPGDADVGAGLSGCHAGVPTGVGQEVPVVPGDRPDPVAIRFRRCQPVIAAVDRNRDDGRPGRGPADVGTVSGATYTSEGCLRSLQSALDKAGG